MNNQSYERITERIVSLLEQGTVPWHKPWTVKTGLPRNLVTQKPYRGINVFLLMAMSYESPHWLTLRQANQLGGTVKKGEKACPVVFWKQMETEAKESEETKNIPLLRLYHVFNVSQCNGLKATPAETPIAVTKPEEIVAKMPQPPAIRHGMTQAFYSPTDDTVGMPERERFEAETGYYAALFHELIHSTGHEKRLKRASITDRNGFGSDPYCKEELIAELGSAFLCGYADIVDRTINNSAAYIEGWLKQFTNDRTLIVSAAAQAQKAADFILGRTFAESEDRPTNDFNPKEFKVVSLRECPVPESLLECDTPDKAAEYWRLHVVTNPYFNPECECFVVLLLNTRRKVKGHQLVTIGTMDALLIHAREVFRSAIVASASAIVLMHNLCAATHKLCYVQRPLMCSHRLAMLSFRRISGRKEGYV